MGPRRAGKSFFCIQTIAKDSNMRNQIANEKRKREKHTSAVVIHELYLLTLSREGPSTAKLRVALVKQSFEVIPVDEQIAELSAELRQKYQLSMGDSMIAATAVMLNAVCVSDDPHFKQIKEIQTTWV
jgi:predicted nucleic acid-binding protein